jgi:IS30 family transposase
MAKRKSRGANLTEEEKLEIRCLIGRGLTQSSVAESVGCSMGTVRLVLRRNGGLKPRSRRRSPRHLALEEREEISRGLSRGEPQSRIAKRLGRSPSTISREIGRNGGCAAYRAAKADAAAWHRARRPKPTKLSRCERLRDEVVALLEDDYSPQQIAGRLAVLHPHDQAMRVSHETIYKSLFVQSRGELRRELTRHLRTRRTRRKAAGEGTQPPNIKDMVMISERPAEIEDRAVPGHWEGDLLLGKEGRSAIVTLVERQTRYVLLGRIGADRTSEHVVKAIAKTIQKLPEHLKASLTWDQGSEMKEHKRFTVESGVKVYFCEPSSPWQRGSNENTNGLLRQYFPKGTDLSQHSQNALDEVAAKLNRRARETLGFMTPAEKLGELLR